MGPNQRIANMLVRGAVIAADASKKMQTLAIRMLGGETKDGIEHFEPYGWTSCPFPGAEHISAFFDGDRSHGVTLMVADRRYRMQNLKPGEIAISTDEGDSIVFKRGRIVEINTQTLNINAHSINANVESIISFVCPQTRINGNISTGDPGGGGGGVTGTFSTGTGQTVTVQDGIVTNIY